MRVGAIADTTGNAYLRKTRNLYATYETVPEALEAIQRGSIDALVYDAPLLRYWVNKKFQGAVKVLPHIILREDYAIALPPQSPLREPINRVLLKKITAPEWQETLHQHLGRPL